MKAILQRVLSASVSVDKNLVSSIGKGVLVFAAIAPGDTEKEIDTIAAKVVNMKLWSDETGNRFLNLHYLHLLERVLNQIFMEQWEVKKLKNCINYLLRE